jgi:hypothetical protein
MLNNNAGINGGSAGTTARWSRRRVGYWFGMLERALEEDRERRGEPPGLVADEVLAWGCAFLGRTGDWPVYNSGAIPEAPGETWLLIAAALAHGLRGLPRTRSLERLFAEHEARFNPADLRLSADKILDWADGWLARTGDWPTRDSGLIVSGGRLNWRLIDRSLSASSGDVAGDSSLADFLASRRGVVRPPLSETQILAWADAFQKRSGRWPTDVCGPVGEARTESWREIQAALALGLRGLPGGSSLAGLLAVKRGVRNEREPRALSTAEIVQWADAYHERAGKWPDSESGAIPETQGDDWSEVEHALVWGGRGLDGGSSLGKLLAEQRGVMRNLHSPELTFPQILSWADTFHARNGLWPTRFSGPVSAAPGESWRSVELAIRFACRGVPRGWTLTKLFIQKRTKKNILCRPRLTVAQILEWADAHHRQTGEWPGNRSGDVAAAPGENWANIQQALRMGFRGLPGGRTLLGLLREERGAEGAKRAPRLSVERILAWADAHHERTGKWPSCRAEAIPESPGDTWRKVNNALYVGVRSVKGGSSLAQLLAARRGVLHRYRRSKLTISNILAWADAFHARTGRWPTSRCGPVAEAAGETWGGIHSALGLGYRGLAGRYSLARLLADERGMNCAAHRRPLSITQILQWADAHRARMGRWPSRESGEITESPGETWSAVQSAMEAGCRGLPAGLSLARLRELEPAIRSTVGLPSLDSAPNRETPAHMFDENGRRRAEEPESQSKFKSSIRFSRKTPLQPEALPCQHRLTSPA